MPWIIANVIYCIYYLSTISISGVIKVMNNHANGYLLITNSWFVIAISIFYIIFYFSFKNNTDNISRGFFLCTIGVLLYIFCAYAFGLGTWWYYSSFSFLLGIYVRYKLDINLRNFCFSTILFFFAYVVRFLNSLMIGSVVIAVVCNLISSAAFPLMIIFLYSKIHFRNGIWIFLGNISFEMYLLHELVYKALRDKSTNLYITNDLLYVILTLGITLVISYVIHKIYRFMKSKFYVGRS